MVDALYVFALLWLSDDEVCVDSSHCHAADLTNRFAAIFGRQDVPLSCPSEGQILTLHSGHQISTGIDRYLSSILLRQTQLCLLSLRVRLVQQPKPIAVRYLAFRS